MHIVTQDFKRMIPMEYQEACVTPSKEDYVLCLCSSDEEVYNWLYQGTEEECIALLKLIAHRMMVGDKVAYMTYLIEEMKGTRTRR